MNPRTNSLPVTALRSLRNAQTRIYAAGSDPVFSRSPRASRPATFRLLPAFPDQAMTGPGAEKLWRPELLDRLQSPVTRYRE